MALAPPAPAAPEVVRGGRRGRRRAPGWTTAGLAVAVLVCAPLLALPLSFAGQGDALDQIAADLLPEALRASIVLALGVGLGTLALGGLLAALVSFYDFPGRRWLDWALVLPMAMPAYVLVFVLLGQYDFQSPLQQALRAVFGDGFRLPEVRSTAGAITVLTLVLYPYVYVLGRTAFLDQSRETLEAARTLGLGHRRAILRIALPLARPALAAGAALAVMEALADFGAVNLLNYRAMTDAIYRVWYGAFDQAAALQLATVLVGLTVSLLLLERLLRGRARYHGALVRGEAVVPRRLHGPAAALATAVPCVLVALVVVLPLAQLVVWSVDSLGDGATPRMLARDALNSLLLATVAAVVTLAAAVLVAATSRARPSRLTLAAVGAASLGYAVPGTVVAVAVYVPLAWVDRRLGALVFSGTVLGLVLAYVVRFHALALSSVRSRLVRIDPSLDEAARALGADRSRVLSEVQLPLLYPGLVTAALLVFVEVLKELPATALLRPLNGDTLAIAVWEATKDSRFDTAALPALLIVLVGLVPVVALMRASRRGLETAPALVAGDAPGDER